MKNQYLKQTRRWWLLLIAITGAGLMARAQTGPPVIQWQRLVENTDSLTSVQLVRASNSGYALLKGKNLIRLSATGEVRWNISLLGTYQDSLGNYATVRQTVALAATPDSGFAVLGLDAVNRYYVTKLNAAGTRVWTKSVDHTYTGSALRVTDNALTTAADGSLLVVGAYRDSLAYLTLTKLSAKGFIAGQWRIKFSDPPQAASPVTAKLLNTTDGGYLLVGAARQGTANGKGVALKLSSTYTLAWQNTYATLDSLRDVVVNPTVEGAYIAIGLGASKKAQALTITPNRTNDGQLAFTFPEAYSPVALVQDGTGNLTVLDSAGTASGDFRLTNFTTQSAIRWVKTFGGSGRDKPTALLATSDGGYLVAGTTTSTDGDVSGHPTSAPATWIVKLGGAAVVTTLNLQAPAYNCQTGAIVFKTTGGDGSPIVYTSPGITRTRLTDDYGIVERELRNDPKVILIQATQSGQTVSYAFDFGLYCRTLQSSTDTLAPNALQLIAPTYNCRTGAITFHTTGGDGTTIEYGSPGITAWTTNPNQFVDRESRTVNDVQPFTLMARQSGRVVMYIFDLKAECSRARIGATEPTAGLGVSVLGNPVRESVIIQVTGAEGQMLQMRLLDTGGRLVEQRLVEQAGSREQQTFDLRQQAPGVLLLHTLTNGQVQSVQVLKQ